MLRAAVIENEWTPSDQSESRTRQGRVYLLYSQRTFCFTPLCSRLHYKECLVDVINQNRLDPVVLFEGPELRAELDRWKIPVPEKQPAESEKLYKERLRQVRHNITTAAVFEEKE